MERIVISDKFSIYKLRYDFIFRKNDLLERAYQSIKLNKTHTNDKNNFFYVSFRCNEFDWINDMIISECSKISNVKVKEWAVQNWIYRMNPNTSAEIYHTHIDLLEGDERIKTDWTFCLYIQVPKNIDNDEGKISFMDEHGIEHLFLPEEGDIIIFPPDLLHTPKLIKNSEMDRIVFAGNISLNPLKKINDKNIF
jgi:hypothetical protein